MVEYSIVVTSESSELVHEYCSYHPMAGPVRPDAVKELRLEGDTVRWFWSENSYDKSSSGANFERRLALTDGRLIWAGPVVRNPNARASPVLPAVSAGESLRLEDTQVESKWWRDLLDDKVAIHVKHTPSGSLLEWDGTSTAENQTIDRLQTRVVNGLLHIAFVYRTSENGDRRASNCDLFVKLGDAGLEWAIS